MRMIFRIFAGLVALAWASGAFAQISPGTFPSFNGTLEKLQKAAQAASASNLVDNPVSAAAATITSLATAPSFTGYTNLTAGNHFWVASPTSATTVAGSNVASVSSATGLLPGQFFVEIPATNGPIPTYVPMGTTIVSVSGLNVTMSNKALASGTPTVGATLSTLDIIGAIPTGYNTSASVMSGGTTIVSSAPAQYNTNFALEFETDAAMFTVGAPGLYLYLNTASSAVGSYRVAIDDVYQTANPVAFTNAANFNWLSIQFAAVATHKVRIELSAGTLLYQLYVYSPSSTWKVKKAIDLRVGFFGDSYFAGGGTGTWGNRNVAAATANLLGVKYDLLAVGGTGYLANLAGGAYPWTNANRLADINRRQYDLFVLIGSINDINPVTLTTFPGNAAYQAAVIATWTAIRAAYPTAPIIIAGVQTTNVGSLYMTSAAAETLLQAAYVQWGDANSVFIPVTNDPDGSWMVIGGNSTQYLCTGQSNAVTGGTNSNDSTHPTDGMGTAFYAKKLADKIRLWVNSTLPL